MQFNSFHLNASTLNQEFTGKFLTLLEFRVLPSDMIMNKTMKILHFYAGTANMLVMNRVDQASLEFFKIISVLCDIQMRTIWFDRNYYSKIEIPGLFLCCNQ